MRGIFLIFGLYLTLIDARSKGFRFSQRVNETFAMVLPLLRSASYVAEKSQPPQPAGTTIFDKKGHIFDVPEQVLYYIELVMKLPGTVVCETGFNAGHSAITFLAANPKTVMYSFDLGDWPWTSLSVEYVKYLFPDRFFYIQGKSTETIKESVLPKGVKCDLFSVDGDHGNAYGDFIAGKAIVNKNAWVIADDYSTSGGAITRDWKRAVDEKLMETMDCHHDVRQMRDGYWKGWCLGRYTGN